MIIACASCKRAEDGIAWAHELYDSFDIPGLSSFGITEDHFPELVAGSKNASSMKGNPAELTDEELTEILQKSVANHVRAG